MNVAERFLYALDPRPGDGYGNIGAARGLGLVLLAVGCYVLAHFGVPIPTFFTDAVALAAVATVSHDTGAAHLSPKALEES